MDIQKAENREVETSQKSAKKARRKQVEIRDQTNKQ